jgi:hypothetical protein
MIREIIDALVAIAFCVGLTFGGKEAYKFVKKETAKLLIRGQNDLSDFNRGLTKKKFDWEK